MRHRSVSPACPPTFLVTRWPTQRRCELDPDLDGTSLYLLTHCVNVPLHVSLARSWVTRNIANHDGGLHELRMLSWSLRPGMVSQRTMTAVFSKPVLDNAYPRMRLQQRTAFAKTRARSFSTSLSKTEPGKRLRPLPAEAGASRLTMFSTHRRCQVSSAAKCLACFVDFCREQVAFPNRPFSWPENVKSEEFLGSRAAVPDPSSTSVPRQNGQQLS